MATKRKIESGKPTRRPALRPALSAFRFPLSPFRTGISLIEILISIFVLLIGLSGVAFIFPVGNHYIVEGEKHDLGSSLAQNAFEELVARGMLRPEAWLYTDAVSTSFIDNNNFNLMFGAGNIGPGLAFVIDPLGGANIPASDGDLFPFDVVSSMSGINMPPAWTTDISTLNPAPSVLNNPGTRWPVRRLTLPQAGGVPFTTPVAETIFRLRDDLAVSQPEQDDHPSIQNWAVDDQGTSDPTDDVLLRRQYKGDYSWLATIVPTSGAALQALQPASIGNSYGELRYDVSVVVFRRREVVPSASSERLIEAEILSDGEIAIYAADKKLVDDAVNEIRPDQWIAVMGVDQTTGDFLFKWYRILSRDEDTSNANLPFAGTTPARFLAINGPDWPANSRENLRVVLMPGVIGVATHQLHMEGTSLWSLE